MVLISSNIIMSTTDALETTRAAEDASHVVRTIRTRQCLKQSIRISNKDLIAESQAPPRIYRDTGVQTQPPPNGDTFTLVYGREPSQLDYVRNTGTAAIGRYGHDCSANTYEVIYGIAYAASAKRPDKITVDSGFQTASCLTTRLALAKAKVKASVMTKKYSEVARQAGYAISAETNGEMITHSEQVPSTVRLDAKGDLLEGSIEGLYLPNIRGELLPPEHKAPQEQDNRSAADGYMATLGAHVPVSQEMDLELLANIAALAPSSREQIDDSAPVLDDEYGMVGPDTDEFVVYDAGNSLSSPAPALPKAPTKASLKRKLSETLSTDTSSKISRLSLPATSTRSIDSATTSSELPAQISHPAGSATSGHTRPDAGKALRTSQSLKHSPPKASHTRAPTVKKPDSTDVSQSNMISVIHQHKLPGNSTICKTIQEVHAPRFEDRWKSGQSRRTNLLLKPSKSSVSDMAFAIEGDETSRVLDSKSAVDMFDNASLERKQCAIESHTHIGANGEDENTSGFLSKTQSQLGHAVAPQIDRNLSASKCDLLKNCRRTQHLSTVPSSSEANSTGHQELSEPTEKKIASRAPRKPRRPFAPYVPPAMRARASRDSHNTQPQSKDRRK